MFAVIIIAIVCSSIVLQSIPTYAQCTTGVFVGRMYYLFIHIHAFSSLFSACISGSCPSNAVCQSGTSCCNITTTTTATTTTCSDTGTGCPLLAYLCTNTVYKTLLQQQCPYTCGRCNSRAIILIDIIIDFTFI